MPDLEILIENLDSARAGLNRARNAAEQWRQGNVAGVSFSAPQRTALKEVFEAGLQAGKDGLDAVDAELQN